MGGRRTEPEKITKYIKNLEESHQNKDSKTAEKLAKEWVGVGKMRLDEDECMRILLLIYGEIQNTPRVTNWIIENYPHLFNIDTDGNIKLLPVKRKTNNLNNQASERSERV
jgi:hypothetical protein